MTEGPKGRASVVTCFPSAGSPFDQMRALWGFAFVVSAKDRPMRAASRLQPSVDRTVGLDDVQVMDAARARIARVPLK